MAYSRKRRNKFVTIWRFVLNKAIVRLTALSMAAAVTFTTFDLDAYASSNKVTSVLPQAGFTYALGSNQVSLSGLQETVETEKAESEEAAAGVSKSTAEAAGSATTVTNVTPLASTVTDSILSDIQNATGAVVRKSGEAEVDPEEELFKTLVIAQVNDYVNVRDLPSVPTSMCALLRARPRMMTSRN